MVEQPEHHHFLDPRVCAHASLLPQTDRFVGRLLGHLGAPRGPIRATLHWYRCAQARGREPRNASAASRYFFHTRPFGGHSYHDKCLHMPLQRASDL